MKKIPSAQGAKLSLPRANFASVVAVGQLDPNALIDACQLSARHSVTQAQGVSATS